MTSSKRLKDYNVGDKATIQLAIVAYGGVLPSIDDLESTPRRLKDTGQLRATTSSEHPDVFYLDNNTTRAIMSCGHAVGRLIFQEIIAYGSTMYSRA